MSEFNIQPFPMDEVINLRIYTRTRINGRLLFIPNVVTKKITFEPIDKKNIYSRFISGKITKLIGVYFIFDEISGRLVYVGETGDNIRSRIRRFSRGYLGICNPENDDHAGGRDTRNMLLAENDYQPDRRFIVAISDGVEKEIDAGNDITVLREGVERELINRHRPKFSRHIPNHATNGGNDNLSTTLVF